jgi:hypothetical protein
MTDEPKGPPRPRSVDLTEDEQKALGAAGNALVLAKATAYDALMAVEQAQKDVALAEAARNAALMTAALAHGLNGNVRLIEGKRIVEG